jgi:hypothetical protein
MHLSHRSDGCSCSQWLLRFLSDIYCSCVIFSYVPFLYKYCMSQLYKETAPLNKEGSRNEPSLIDEVGQGWRRWCELMWTP